MTGSVMGDEASARSSIPARPSVLLVDDYPANLLALEAVLAPLAVRLVRATSGIEALEALVREDFAVIILDVQMPGLDGFETAARIRQQERTREVPILFVTAVYRDDAYEARGYAHGAVDYLTKPFNPHVLRAKVAGLVDLWQRSETLLRRETELFEQEQVKLRSEIFTRAEQLRLIVDGVRDHAISMLDPEGRVLMLNAPATRIKGYSLAEVQGQHFRLFFTDEDRTAGLPEKELEVAEREGTFKGEGVRRRKDGSIFHAQVSLSALRDLHGKLTGFVKVTYDISAQVKARQEVEAALQQAEEANRAKDAFLAVASHELRTPLTAILGWSRMLRKGVVPEEKRERALETIERNAHVQVQLVEDILDVSRIITGKLQLTLSHFDLVSIVEAAVEVVRPAAAARGVRLQVLLDPAAGIVHGDATRLQQVAWNLLANAIKFTPKTGRVYVRLQREHSRVELVVSDTGAGIDPSFLPYVFQPFRQQDASITRAHGGLGLGLAIVKHLVELHGGTIEAASEGVGKGASFAVRIPISPVTSSSLAPPSTPDARSTLPGGSLPDTPTLAGIDVLIVDDEPDTRDLIKSVLEACNATVRTAGSAAEAMEVFRARPPDVLVSDIGMPNASGYALIRDVRALPADHGGQIPAIALTAYAATSDRTQALREGFTMHVAKPTDPQELVAAIAVLVGRTRASGAPG